MCSGYALFLENTIFNGKEEQFGVVLKWEVSHCRDTVAQFCLLN